MELIVPEFIITVKTDNPGDTDDHSFQIPIEIGRTYDYDVDWGDGSTTEGTTTSAVHTYVTAGLHQIKISGTFPAIRFNFGGDKNKLISIDNWGTNVWEGMTSAFAGCSHLSIDADDSPDLSAIGDLTYAFRSTGLTTENLNEWDVSTVETFIGTFQDTIFNGDISDWDMSSAVNISAMFYGAYAFNQDVSAWDVSNVTNMNSMFEGATAFNNSDLTNVHLHPITWGARTSQVTNMQGMFVGNTHFNQDIGSWDTSSVTTMAYMLSGATLFDQSLGGWDVGSVVTMDTMLAGTGMSVRNYDTTLKGWSDQTLEADVVLGAGSVTYCDGVPHDILTNDPNNWTITDGGLVCGNAPTISFENPTPENGVTLGASSIEVALSSNSDLQRYSFVNFDHSLLGWWRFEQTGIDESGNDTASIWTGNESYAVGQFGDAGNFDGATSFDVLLNDPITSSFTVSAWVYLDAVTVGAAIIGDQNGHLIQIGGSGRWQFDNTYSADAVAHTRVWTHVAGVYDAEAETETMYINGVNVSSGGGTRTLSAALNIGKRTDDIYVNGKIDEVLVFNRALGEDEIAMVYGDENAVYDHDFTDLSTGEHSFKGYIVDAYATMASTEERIVNPTEPYQETTPRHKSPSGQRITYGCKDPRASNYTYFAASNPLLCIYQPQASVLNTLSIVSASSSPFTRDLSYEMTGQDVQDLQKFLVVVDTGPAARALALHGTTDYFGVLTQAAVAEFQKAHDVYPVAGYFGPLTRVMVDQILAKK